MTNFTSFDIEKILEMLPHRYPMLLVDRITEYEPGKRAKGFKNLTFNEDMFQGHFPGRPVMPGVLIVEAMAQVGSVILLADPQYAKFTPLLVAVENARFRHPVVPGDRLVSEVELVYHRNGVGKIRAKGTVDHRIVAEMELAFKLVPRET